MFRSAGFEVTLSSLYRDLETEKPREIDVFAAHKDCIGVTQIAFIVECKSTKNPWLLLCDPEVLTGYNRVHSFVVANKNAYQDIVEDPVFDSLMENCPWFSKAELTGYSLRNAFSSKDIAYEAATSVAKASLDFVKSADSYQQRMAFPIIVVTSPLIRCSLDEKGEIVAQEIKQGEVFFKYGLSDPFMTCIRVVTLGALSDFVQVASQVASLLRTELFGAEIKLWEDHFSSPHPRAESRSPDTNR